MKTEPTSNNFFNDLNLYKRFGRGSVFSVLLVFLCLATSCETTSDLEKFCWRCNLTVTVTTYPDLEGYPKILNEEEIDVCDKTVEEIRMEEKNATKSESTQQGGYTATTSSVMACKKR